MTRYENMAAVKRKTGLTKSRIEQICEQLSISTEDGIPTEIIETILSEQEMYISFSDFAARPRDDNYDGTTGDKRKLLDELEQHDYFGLTIVDPEELLIGTQRDRVFFYRTDIEELERNLSQYFRFYGLSVAEKVRRLLKETDRKATRNCLEKYVEEQISDEKLTPAFSEFVGLVLEFPDLPNIQDDDIKQALNRNMTVAAQNHLIDFLNYAKRCNGNTQYSWLKKMEREVQKITGYDNATYLALARCIFNAEYIAQNRLIEKALENHFFIEMWLYLALYFCCGWRAGDICRGWRYLRLFEKPDNMYGINKDTLWEDILYDRLPDEVYERVCDYAIHSVVASGQMPSKTAKPGAPSLTIAIASELKVFFGLLTLISEAVMLRDHDGYMKPERANTYQHQRLYRKFFGEDMFEALHGRNIQSRRLNKDYLQGIEETARQNGCGALLASAVASYARSHSNLDTIARYLDDHTLNAENADMVLYFMLERGVFGFEIYQTLKAAYPDAFVRLPMQKQNELIKEIGNNPFLIELGISGFEASLKIKDAFECGDNEVVLNMLKGMYEITQDRGRGKDTGVYCTLVATGNRCAYPEYDSCLANACPHLVLTKYGYQPLLEVIKKYLIAGDMKSMSVLKKVIMPRFREIINTLFETVNMTPTERSGVRLMLEEVYKNGS